MDMKERKQHNGNRQRPPASLRAQRSNPHGVGSYEPNVTHRMDCFVATLLAMTVFLLFFANPVFAACSSPSGTAGQIYYNNTDSVLQYCDDTNWVSMGAGPGTGGGCSSPSGTAGQIYYNTTHHIAQYCNGNEWVEMGSGEYRTHGVHFDGVNDYADIASALAGVSDSKKLTASFWFRTGITGTNRRFYDNNGGANPFAITVGSFENLRFQFQDNTDTEVAMVQANAITGMGWTHVLFSIDTTGTCTYSVYINDQPATLSGSTYCNNDAVFDFTNGGNKSLGQQNDGSKRWDGDMADVWMDFGTYMDFSVTANRRKFIDANGWPVDLGADGSTPTGTAPTLFFTGDTSDWATNKGTGGTFTENGALEDATEGPSPLTTGLVGHWKLDDGSGSPTAADSSGNGNTGTLTYMSASTDWTTGMKSGALDFDGVDDMVNIASSSSLDSLGAGGGLTFCSWAYIRNYGKNANSYRTIFAKEQSTAVNGWYVFVQDTAKFGIVTNNLDFARVVDSSLVPLNEWKHLCASWDGSAGVGGVDLYVDGAPVPISQSGSRSGTAGDDAGQPAIIGNDVDHEFDGVLDDVRVYNRVLSATEVQQLYGCTSPANIEGTMMYNTTDSVMQYCNGVNWIGIGK